MPFGLTSLPVVIALGAAAMAWTINSQLRWMLDDSFISLVYARNLVNGHGLVFNAGEFVEGYTNLLWVLLAALGISLGIDAATWLHLLGGAAFSATVFGVFLLAREIQPSRPLAAAMGALVVALYLPLAYWSGSGMETPLFSALLVVSLWLHVRGASLATPLALWALTLTRPEGMLVAAICFFDALRRDTRVGMRYALTYGTLLSALIAWRFWYYGDWLPNTFRAKVGGLATARGYHYLLDWLRNGHGALLLALLCASSAVWRRAVAPVAFVGLAVLYVLMVGGDAFAHHRFLVPLVPVVVGVIVASSPGLAVSLLAVFLVYIEPMATRLDEAIRQNANHRRLQDEICRDLAGMRGIETIATGGIGALKWCTNKRVVDILGLTNRRVATSPIAKPGMGLAGHERSNADAVMAEEPDYLVIPHPESLSGRTPAVQDLWAHRHLAIFYQSTKWGYIRLPPGVIARRRAALGMD